MATNKAQIEFALRDAARIGKKAAIRALNDTLYKIASKHMPEKIKSIFDRPTSAAINAVKYKKFDENSNTGKVYIPTNDTPTGYFEKDGSPKHYDTKYEFMFPQIFGGERALKASEDRLRKSRILPNDMFIAPGQHMRLDRYGNIPKGEMTKILSALNAFTLSGEKSGFDMDQTSRSIKRNKKAYTDLFVVNKKGNGQSTLPMGIYRRANDKRTARQLIIFIKKPLYKVKFNFFGIASEAFDKEYRKQLNYQLSKSGGAAGPPSEVF